MTLPNERHKKSFALAEPKMLRSRRRIALSRLVQALRHAQRYGHFLPRTYEQPAMMMDESVYKEGFNDVWQIGRARLQEWRAHAATEG